MVAAILLGPLAACGVSQGTDASPVVYATDGTFEGVAQPNLAEGGAFLGIPFAMPPVAELRWQPPKLISAANAIVMSKSYAPACVQGDYTTAWYADLIEAFGGDPSVAATPAGESEDCLYLNVWSPDLAPDKPAPVMVWIHGGSYKGGWSYEPNYVGEKLSAQQGVVVVSIAYRLGPFGYLGPDADTAGTPVNFGLMDQITALEWVQRNIAAFGGDPDNVTIFGESAGAASVGTLLTMPETAHLYRRAISESGGFEFLHRPNRAEAAAAFGDLTKKLEADGTSPFGATARQILDASNTVLANYDFGPVVDGDLVPQQPALTLEAGQINPADLIIGTNRDEWLMYLDPDTISTDLADWKTNHPAAAELVDGLSEKYGEASALDWAETAEFMRCPGLRLASVMSQQDKSVYVYEFNRARSGAMDVGLGSYHGAEIPYVFDTHDNWLPTDAADQDITAFMTSTWARFARTGSPNIRTDTVWPDYGKTGLVLKIDQERDTGKPESASLCASMFPSDSAGSE